MAAAGEIPMLDDAPAISLAGLTDLQVRRLQRLVPCTEHELRHYPLYAIDVLQDALDGELRRGRNRHWSYDINRHFALRKALDFYQGKRGTPQ